MYTLMTFLFGVIVPVYVKFLRSDLNINFEKYTLCPTTFLTYLGICIDLKNKSLRLTEKMFAKVSRAVRGPQARLACQESSGLVSGGLINFIISALGLPASQSLAVS